VEEILKTTREENLHMITDSVQYLVSQNRKVFVDLEHFYDGYAQDPDYALQCCQAAVDGGASCLVLCDTNGGTMPWVMEQATKAVVETFDTTTVGVHCHNDCGMAVANSIMASKAGAGLIQGTINGIGERTGNANLCSIIPSLALHVKTQFLSPIELKDMTTVSRFVDEVLNRTPTPSAPFVGASAFAHKGGLHVAAMERNPLSYQHIDPLTVGNEPRYLISELSGRQNILGKMKKVGLVDDNASERALKILDRVKELEAKGYTFEGAEASVDLMILHATRGYCPPFHVLDYSAQVYDTNVDSSTRVLAGNWKDSTNGSHSSPFGPTARATINVRTINLDDSAYDSVDAPLAYIDHLEVSDGNGPVDALAKALKKALLPSHPSLEGMELVDYKVRILDPESATGAATRVMIEFRDGDETWTTVSVDRNIISASVNALVDGFEYALIEHAQSCMVRIASCVKKSVRCSCLILISRFSSLYSFATTPFEKRTNGVDNKIQEYS
jgi:2-isopropylmalate synthase